LRKGFLTHALINIERKMNAIITGASRGIGKAIAAAFAKEGYHLFLNSRSELALYKAVEELYAEFPGIHIKAVPADLSKKEGCTLFANAVLEEADTVDVLVNNAGLYFPGNVYNEPEGQMEETMNVNFYSAYHLTRALIGKMISQKQGHIFNMCSIASMGAYENGGSYSISKYAMLGFGKNLREEMKPFGIKVTNLMPGAVYTDSWSGSGVDPTRIMKAEDIADLVVTCSKLSPMACVEDIVLRPQLGDL
jgi:short-subunit dehydrogenase